MNSGRSAKLYMCIKVNFILFTTHNIMMQTFEIMEQKKREKEKKCESHFKGEKKRRELWFTGLQDWSHAWRSHAIIKQKPRRLFTVWQTQVDRTRMTLLETTLMWECYHHPSFIHFFPNKQKTKKKYESFFFSFNDITDWTHCFDLESQFFFFFDVSKLKFGLEQTQIRLWRILFSFFF